jgi:bifunctional non-homologous end joining protein LigD
MPTAPRRNADGVISHPDKVLFPEDGITKRDLAAYYEAMATVMLPHIRGRPVTMERFPSGIGQPGFLQKDVSKGFPDWLQRVEVPKKGGSVHHPLVNDRRSLLWLANQNCITPHVWTSRAPNVYQPDICVFDLDPSEEAPDRLRAAALAVRDLLDELGLPSWLKTSGSKGFHIVVPLNARDGFDEVAAFAQAAAATLVERNPRMLTLAFSKADRGDRIYVDVGRNGYSATFATAYAVRARPGAPVSAPCTWDELERGDVGPRTFTLRTMASRIDKVGDLWSNMRRRKHSVQRARDNLSGGVG